MPKGYFFFLVVFLVDFLVFALGDSLVLSVADSVAGDFSVVASGF